MSKLFCYVASACVLLVAGMVLADTLTLSDGSTLEGRVVPQGDKYWIKLTTGESKMIPKSQITNWTKSAAPAPAPTPAAGGGSTAGSSAKPAAPAAGSPTDNTAPGKAINLSFSE